MTKKQVKTKYKNKHGIIEIPISVRVNEKVYGQIINDAEKRNVSIALVCREIFEGHYVERMVK